MHFQSFVFTQEMLTMSLACMELQLEQWSHTKGKNSECLLTLFLFSSVITHQIMIQKAVYYKILCVFVVYSIS